MTVNKSSLHDVCSCFTEKAFPFKVVSDVSAKFPLAPFQYTPPLRAKTVECWNVSGCRTWMICSSAGRCADAPIIGI